MSSASRAWIGSGLKYESLSLHTEFIKRYQYDSSTLSLRQLFWFSYKIIKHNYVNFCLALESM